VLRIPEQEGTHALSRIRSYAETKSLVSLSPSAITSPSPIMGEAADDTPRPTIELTPVIKEMVRTQVCFENIKLLVDRISIVPLSVVEDPLKNEAFRLLLTDGEVSIQGKGLVFRKGNRLTEDI